MAALMRASLSVGHFATGLLGRSQNYFSKLETCLWQKYLLFLIQIRAGNLPEVECIISPVINCQVQMVCGDGSNNVLTTGFDCFDGILSCAVLEDDFELL